MDRYVTEEIFVREGLALNLNENDEIVRRRIAQKFEFLQTDLAAPKEPSAAALKAWFSQNQSHYISAPSVSFTHVYFSADRDGDAAARARAAATLKTLRAEKRARAPQLGDSFPGPADVGSLTPDAAERLFGKSQLSEELFTLPPGQWAGPFQSGYGWHLVYVTDKKAPQLPSFDEVRAKVHDDYMDGERGRLNAATFEKLRSKYTVVYDGDGT
jgi:parvulin-like peptidyl-prolyl isomerase